MLSDVSKVLECVSCGLCSPDTSISLWDGPHVDCFLHKHHKCQLLRHGTKLWKIPTCIMDVKEVRVAQA